MPVFEAVLVGFDGNTDKTDHLIKWVEAPCKSLAQEACVQRGWDVSTLQETDLDSTADGIDDGIDVVVGPLAQDAAGIRVPAYCYSDDHLFSAKFDAAPWLASAEPEQIEALARCGWGGDEPTDWVAEFMADKDKGVQAMFDHLRAIKDLPSHKDVCGFECNVDFEAARNWLRENRPEISIMVEEIIEETVAEDEAMYGPGM